MTVCVCVRVEADGVSGSDPEDLLCDSSEHLGGAPPSGPHWPLLAADGELAESEETYSSLNEVTQYTETLYHRP